MQKPNGYDEAKVRGEFTPVELGGHYMIIKQVAEKKSSNGDDMIVVLFDFDKSDKQADYFIDKFKDDIRPDKKWPNQATQYIMVYDYQDNDKTSSAFKTFTTCVEHSNTGFQVRWGIPTKEWCDQFKGKKIGGVFGEQMDFYDGKVMKKHILRWFCSTEKVAEAAIPNITESKGYKNRPVTTASPDENGFMSIPDTIDEELPFN